MESCYEKSDITNINYRRVRDLVCQSKIPYKGPLNINKKIENNNYLLLFIILSIIIIISYKIIFYKRGATNLFK
mgnify:CR=1 FL=1